MDGLIHFKKPFKFTSNIAFGDHDDILQYCPNDKSKINFTLSIGSPKQANETYESINVEDSDRCTKEIVKFSPVPQFKDCKTSDLERVLAINDVKMDVEFEKVINNFIFLKPYKFKNADFSHRCQKHSMKLHQEWITFYQLLCRERFQL